MASSRFDTTQYNSDKFVESAGAISSQFLLAKSVLYTSTRKTSGCSRKAVVTSVRAVIKQLFAKQKKRLGKSAICSR